MKKILIVCGSLIAVILVLHYGAAFFVGHFGDCAKSCRWNEAKESYDCSPLEPHLEVLTSREPISGKPVYWYRASVKNATCDTLRLGAGFFADNENYFIRIKDNETRIEVVDENGTPLAPVRDAPTGIRGVESDIHPYIYDSGELGDSFESKVLPNQSGYSVNSIVLPPRVARAASPMKLSPYRNELRTVETKDYVGTGIFKTPAKIQNPESIYAAPPAGFRRLIEYDLSRPGRYNARFVIHENLVVNFNESTPGNRIRRIVSWLARPRLFSDREKIIPVDARSEARTFEVRR